MIRWAYNSPFFQHGWLTITPWQQHAAKTSILFPTNVDLLQRRGVRPVPWTHLSASGAELCRSPAVRFSERCGKRCQCWRPWTKTWSSSSSFLRAESEFQKDRAHARCAITTPCGANWRQACCSRISFRWFPKPWILRQYWWMENDWALKMCSTFQFHTFWI